MRYFKTGKMLHEILCDKTTVTIVRGIFTAEKAGPVKF